MRLFSCTILYRACPIISEAPIFHSKSLLQCQDFQWTLHNLRFVGRWVTISRSLFVIFGHFRQVLHFWCILITDDASLFFMKWPLLCITFMKAVQTTILVGYHKTALSTKLMFQTWPKKMFAETYAFYSILQRTVMKNVKDQFE